MPRKSPQPKLFGQALKFGFDLRQRGLRGAAFDARLRRLLGPGSKINPSDIRRILSSSDATVKAIGKAGSRRGIASSLFPKVTNLNWTVAGKPRYQYWFKFKATDKNTGKRQEYFSIVSSRRILDSEEIRAFMEIRLAELRRRYILRGFGRRIATEIRTESEFVGAFRRY